MYGKFRKLVGALGQVENIVQLFQYDFLAGPLKAVDGTGAVEDAIYIFHTVLKGGNHGRYGELDDQSFVGRALRIFGFVEQGRAQSHNITAAHIVPDSIYQVSRLFVQKDAHLVKLMEMLKFHIDRVGAFVIVEIVVKVLAWMANFYFMFFRIDNSIVNQHFISPDSYFP